MTFRNATQEEWDTITEADPTSTYSQTREWYEIWSQYDGLHIDTKIFEFSDGPQVLLPLAYASYFHGIIKKYLSSPNGVGGFVAKTPLNNDEKSVLYGVVKRISTITLIENPFSTILDGFNDWGIVDSTHVIDLTIGFDELFKKWSKGHSSAAKKGIREGVLVEIARNEESWKQYFHCYENSLKRWGARATSRYSWKLFELMLRKNSNKIKLWLAKAADTNNVIGGCLCFYHNKHIAYWHGAALEEYFSLRPIHTIQYYIMKDACDGHYHWYDMGSSGGHEGVRKFKEGFSPQEKALRIYSRFSPVMQFGKFIRRQFLHNYRG